MMQEGLRHFTDTPLTVFAMLIFIVTYVGVVCWLARPSGGDWQRAANIPLDGEGEQS